MARVGRRREAGMVAAEFLTLLALFVLLLFLLVQVSLASLAKMAVGYASFSAVRAAVVVLPAGASPEKVRMAAAYPLMTVSPPDEGGIEEGMLARRIRYAKRATAVRIRPLDPAWDEQVTVDVAYLFECFMPLAAQFMCKRYEEAREGWEFSGSFPGRYLLLRGRHTLTNQGRP